MFSKTLSFHFLFYFILSSFKKNFLHTILTSHPQKVLKIWCLLNANIKTNEEVKTKRFKLLKPSSLIPNQIKNLYLHISSYAIKDGQISRHTIICTNFSKDLHAVRATSKCMRYIKGDMYIVIKYNLYIIHHISLKVTIT